MDKKTLFNKFKEVKKIQNENTLRVNMYGYLSEIILSTELFTSNKDLPKFFQFVSIDHKEYLYSNRTSLIAMTIRRMQRMDIKELMILQSKVMDFLFEHDNDINEPVINSRKTNSSDDYVNDIVNKYSRGK
ncbi:hypothetical protein MMB75_15825 [Paenibacillus sp. P2(2022)]|uniref:hypothetical protein n=1 Tax=Paenibacillus TaxID=44249 RepID=UPI000368B18D|nr:MULTISPECIES: hypothetical protein [Paenibacillus]KJK32048.1 hypothetical protein TY89_05690 [Paenibacillus polymyxa]MDG0055151.1 hypothetical protein [Paenibacillus sp. P2(2022)]MDN4076485.1 hypothetical protein [Paenibacillus polymyxa]MDN4086438.1 hypothetical protein [Paenibacillus polymyxa]MDN4101911.1 hypothetical protein [Paenibacillus polymyxa]